MLQPENLANSANWIMRARLWRILLLADRRGFWDPSQSLAVALSACKIRMENIRVVSTNRFTPHQKVGWLNPDHFGYYVDVRTRDYPSYPG